MVPEEVSSRAETYSCSLSVIRVSLSRICFTMLMPSGPVMRGRSGRPGLSNNSFQPTSEIRVLRTYWRQRLQHVTGAATCVQRMQKALTQMNIQLANVISDRSGVTGQLIVRAMSVGNATRGSSQNSVIPGFRPAGE